MLRIALVLLLAGVVLGERSFRIDFGSCHDLRRIHKNPELANIWNEISARNPDFFVWGGDNIYGDYLPLGKELFNLVVNDFDYLKEKFPPFIKAYPEDLKRNYAEMERLEQYQNFIKSIGHENIVGTWDDHDFGWNDAGKEYDFKDISQQLLLDFLKVPKDDPRREMKGAYSSKIVHNGRIKIVLLDNRYFKDDYSNASGDFLGDDQWDWLEHELNDGVSKVDVTLVISGIQVLPDDNIRVWFGEAWEKLPASRRKLFDVISRSKSKGVFLISGDVHYSEMMLAKCSNGESSFFLPEMTTSGMTHSWTGYPFFMPMLMNYVHGFATSPYQVDGMYDLRKNFGEIDFFLDEPNGENYITVRVLENTGGLIYETKYELSSLKSVASLHDSTCGPHINLPKWLRTAKDILAILVLVYVVLLAVFYSLKLILSMCFGSKRTSESKKNN